ncbi:MAG: regulatory protein RecX [Chitinophagaceae bacterium]
MDEQIRKTEKITKQQAIPKIEYYCSYQERCHKEVTSKLYDYGLNTDEVGEVLTHLVKAGFLNEERFARAYAGGKFRQKNWGKTRIIRELKMRGISDYCIKKAMSEIDDDDYEESLKIQAEKYLATHKGGIGWQLKQKALKHLVSKGYEYEECHKILQKLIG